MLDFNLADKENHDKYFKFNALNPESTSIGFFRVQVSD